MSTNSDRCESEEFNLPSVIVK